MMEDEGYQEGSRTGPVWTWGPPAGAALLIFILSSVPGDSLPEHPYLLSSFIHVLEFGILAYFLARAIMTQSLADGRIKAAIWTVLICSAYGLFDEARQFLVPNRVFDLYDVLADGMGAVAGTVIYMLRTGYEGRG
jgi:VanZ family protein